MVDKRLINLKQHLLTMHSSQPSRRSLDKKPFQVLQQIFEHEIIPEHYDVQVNYKECLVHLHHTVKQVKEEVINSYLQDLEHNDDTLNLPKRMSKHHEILTHFMDLLISVQGKIENQKWDDCIFEVESIKYEMNILINFQRRFFGEEIHTITKPCICYKRLKAEKMKELRSEILTKFQDKAIPEMLQFALNPIRRFENDYQTGNYTYDNIYYQIFLLEELNLLPLADLMSEEKLTVFLLSRNFNHSLFLTQIIELYKQEMENHTNSQESLSFLYLEKKK